MSKPTSHRMQTRRTAKDPKGLQGRTPAASSQAQHRPPTEAAARPHQPLEPANMSKQQVNEALQAARSDLASMKASLKAVSRTANMLHSSLDYKTVVERAVQAMMTYSQSPLVGIFGLQAEATHFELIYTKGFSPKTIKHARNIPVKGSLTGLAAVEKKIAISRDMASDERLFPKAKKTLLEEGRRSAICVPLLYLDRVIGVMNLLFEEERIPTLNEQETLLSIGRTIALAMENAKHVAQIEEEIAERKRAEAALKKAHTELEQRVEERTAELLAANKMLIREMQERMQVEEDLRNTEEKYQRRQRAAESEGRYGLIGRSKPMQHVFEIIQKAAQSPAPVIIYGESGTGKELVAHAIHQLGERNQGPFLQLNCAALSESLLESELFGHVQGAFTGALKDRIGRFEAADGGDLFLDEIGDIPLYLQTKLLRVLETQRFERIGDSRPVSVNVRIICATNKDLEVLIAQKLFRKDLYFRINVIPIHLPPLRERIEDLPVLVASFMRRLQRRSGKKITGLSPAAMKHLTAYPWPGNVRELKSVLEYAFVIAEQGLIQLDHLPPGMVAKDKATASAALFATHPRKSPQKSALVEALQKCQGNQSEAARLLGINRMTVWNRMKKYGIDLKKVVAVEPLE